jgi:hypothetical protein
MLQLQLSRVEEISGQGDAGLVFGGQFAGRAVECIADNGVAKRSQMHPDLVGSPSVNSQFQ